MAKELTLSDIFISYADKLRLVVGFIVQPEDIDDIVQDTFLRSYEADLKTKIQYSRSYMLTTAKNLALNHVEKWDNKFNDSITDVKESLPQLTTLDFEAEFESKERFLVFIQATNLLTKSVRKCFVLKRVYGLSQKEIAHKLLLSESTVEKHVAKGLLKCAIYMEQIYNSQYQNTLVEVN
ncbi:RNA polymerase sigma factor [Colwelliaceae bacterium BS250]